MPSIIYQPGDKVRVFNGWAAHAGHLAEQLAALPALQVVRQMPHSVAEYGRVEYELSDGSIHAESELHLVERAPSEAPADKGK